MTGEMDWTTRLLYLTIIFGILILGAALLYLICYLTSRNDEGEDSSNNNATPSSRARPQKAAPAGEGGGGGSDLLDRLRATATAISAIPLKELGGKNADIIIDVAQQMCFGKDHLNHEEHHCIVCRARKEITWEEVSCFAQTTIGVLVYKRTLVDDADKVVASKQTGLVEKRQTFAPIN